MKEEARRIITTGLLDSLHVRRVEDPTYMAGFEFGSPTSEDMGHPSYMAVVLAAVFGPEGADGCSHTGAVRQRRTEPVEQ